jgi:hypothetical protein
MDHPYGVKTTAPSTLLPVDHSYGVKNFTHPRGVQHG